MGANCDSKSDAEYEKSCYTYIHVYNNLVRNSEPYLHDAAYLYSDTSSGQNVFENNLLYGNVGTALKHHCVSCWDLNRIDHSLTFTNFKC